jgi:ATP-dependent Clp protease ATP-binding subunit ClpA
LLSLKDFADDAREVCQEAQARANREHHELMTAHHLVTVALELGYGLGACQRAGVDPRRLLAAAKKRLAALSHSDEPSFLDRDAISVVRYARRHAALRERSVDLESLFVGLAHVQAIPATLTDKEWPASERCPNRNGPSPRR